MDKLPISGHTKTLTNPDSGLTAEQVQKRIAAGKVNRQGERLTPSYPAIILKNTLTLFNLINIALAVVIFLVGHPENTLFLGIALCNTVMGIFQEVRAKRTLDKLSVLAQAKASVLRDGKTGIIPQDDIVLDDIVNLAAGDQICADAMVLSSFGLETDESLLTGETDRIPKGEGDTVLSGSYVTGGRARVCVTAVGADNYANALTAAAKKEKKNKSKLLGILNRIIQVLTIVILPLGGLLFYSMYSGGEAISSAVLSASAAMIGMIPEGLVLLTGITLTVGAMTLARKKALVQSLPSIETLARVDVLCLDKTGTITDGTLTLERLEVLGDASEQKVQWAVKELMAALKDENSTAKALRASFGESQRWRTEVAVPFSSERKWSGATFRNVGTYVIGAPGMLLDKGDPALQQAGAYADQGLRVVCLAFSQKRIFDGKAPDDLVCEALIVLSDTIRQDARDTFRFFADEGVKLKVISGDNPRTVSAIAAKAGLDKADKCVDMSTVGHTPDYATLSQRYTVFGHVTPQQKKELVLAMQENGHTVCMTGDGVNDILAMREADCSVAMVGGSDAARSACDFVLMSSSFASMTSVLKEGRRVINNIDRVSSLYLAKTIYSVLLTLVYIFLPMAYPFDPLQLTPVNAFTIGIPSFFLALQANYARPSERMVANIVEHSFPAALTILFNTLYLQAAAHLFDLSRGESSTMIVFMIGIVGFYLLLRLSRPLSRSNKWLLAALGTGFFLLFLFFGNLFTLSSLLSRNLFFYLPLTYFSYHIHGFLSDLCKRLMRERG